MIHTSRTLHTGWTGVAASGPTQVTAPFPATVPGTVHTDLLAAGLIPDPYLDNNEAALAWIGLVDWTYSLTFDGPAEPAARHHLVFDGIDTVATITLNGITLADVANQHRTYRFDVTSHLRATNTLVVAFRSPIREANRRSLELGARPRAYPLPYESLRKSACNFGWDWGIATYTSGLWREVRLESFDVARLADIAVAASVQGTSGIVTVDATIERLSDEDLTVTATVDGVEEQVLIPAGQAHAQITLRLEDITLWWPTGHGDQPLYDVEITLTAGDAIDRAHRRVGFRTLSWNTAPDDAGTPFQLVINDRPIYVKGVNWIPDDAVFPRVTPERYRRRLEQAVGANLNLIRVWGGGIYEDDAFYDICDELGLLTWQDFLFACAAYPEEEPLRSEVAAEARDNVARIAHHTSLVLLTGNNENLWGHEDWNWKSRLDGATWGAGYYFDLLPAIVQELAPHVPYAPGSPFSPDGSHPNDDSHGTSHLWEQWNRKDYLTYREHRPRFVAEFGWQGPPAWTTLTAAISDDPLTPESPGMIVHQKAAQGNEKLLDGLQRHFRAPADMETWHWAMQLNQAMAVRFALEWFRSLAPHNSGAIVWQLNDCWPVTSWAAIDSNEREKPLYFAIRHAFAPRAVTVQPEGDSLVAVFSNDTANAWTTTARLSRITMEGVALAEADAATDIPAWGTFRVVIPAEIAHPATDTGEALVVSADGVQHVALFVEPRDSELPPAAVTAKITPAGDGFDVTLTATALVLDLALLVDKIHPDARVDDGLVTLLPGQSHVFRVTGVPALTTADITRALCTANDLVR